MIEKTMLGEIQRYCSTEGMALTFAISKRYMREIVKGNNPKSKRARKVINKSTQEFLDGLLTIIGRCKDSISE